jgi:copper chaperone
VKVDLAAKQVSVQSQLTREVIAGLIREEGYSVA